MSNSVVANPNQFMRGLDQSYARFEKKMQKRMRIIVTEAMKRLIRRTPVHTGQAVRSYVASSGTPFGGGAASASKPVQATNQLPLGTERLRGGAAAQAMGTIGMVDFSDPFQNFWITNSAPHIGGLEAGELPRAPYTPRSPQGMFAVTLQELITLLDAGMT